MDQNSTNKPAGSGILRVTSIILIVYAVIALVAGLFMMMGVYVLAADADVDAAAGVAAIVGIVAFLGGLLNLFVGVVGSRPPSGTAGTAGLLCWASSAWSSASAASSPLSAPVRRAPSQTPR